MLSHITLNHSISFLGYPFLKVFDVDNKQAWFILIIWQDWTLFLNIGSKSIRPFLYIYFMIEFDRFVHCKNNLAHFLDFLNLFSHVIVLQSFGGFNQFYQTTFSEFQVMCELIFFNVCVYLHLFSHHHHHPEIICSTCPIDRGFLDLF